MAFVNPFHPEDLDALVFQVHQADYVKIVDWKRLTELIEQRVQAIPGSILKERHASTRAPVSGSAVPDVTAPQAASTVDAVFDADESSVYYSDRVAALHCPIQDATIFDGVVAATLMDDATSDDWPEISHLEQIDDREELAHILLNSGLCPHDHPRVEALFRRAVSGNGYHSQRLHAWGLI